MKKTPGIEKVISKVFVLFAFLVSVTVLPGCRTVAPEVKKEPAKAEKKAPAKAALPAANPLVAAPELVKKEAPKDIHAVSLSDLEDAEYSSLSAYKGSVKLTRGLFKKKNAPKSATETMVAMTNHSAFGKVSGKEGAAAILVTTTGTAGFYYDLAFIVKEKGKTRNIATSPLGDRVKIKSLSIQNGVISVSMVRHRKKDLACCPTEEVTQKYTLMNNKLVTTK